MHRFLALSEQRFAPIPCFKRLETPNLIKTKRFACQERDLAPIQSGSNRLGTRFAEIEPPLSLEKKTHVKKALADALTQRGYETLTPVQKAVTEADLHNADLLVSAQTGSGKTVGFGLALGETLLGAQDNFGNAEAPLALIIAPTRELALQVKRELAWLYAPAGVVMASCVGGMDMRDERRALGRGAHIVVATPGRLRDHIMRGSIDLSAVRGVVLDEADEMLDLGFREDLEFILGEAPDDRRTLMFSATVPKAIATLAKSYQRDAVRVTTVAETKPHNDIKYHAMTTTTRDDQQQQQQQRSTARRDQLTSYQTIAQKSWQDSKVFEVHSDETKPIKFFGNFPYPYMNGLLHLGHAFSLSKLVRFFCYRYYSLRVIRSLSFVRLFLCVCRRRSRAFFSFGV